jgi:hypothetical protein
VVAVVAGFVLALVVVVVALVVVVVALVVVVSDLIGIVAIVVSDLIGIVAIFVSDLIGIVAIALSVAVALIRSAIVVIAGLVLVRTCGTGSIAVALVCCSVIVRGNSRSHSVVGLAAGVGNGRHDAGGQQKQNDQYWDPAQSHLELLSIF